jgi:hypothetical protein
VSSEISSNGLGQQKNELGPDPAVSAEPPWLIFEELGLQLDMPASPAERIALRNRPSPAAGAVARR